MNPFVPLPTNVLIVEQIIFLSPGIKKIKIQSKSTFIVWLRERKFKKTKRLDVVSDSRLKVKIFRIRHSDCLGRLRRQAYVGRAGTVAAATAEILLKI